MVVKFKRTYEPKRAGGVNLRESVWERVELTAMVENISLSQVMDTVLGEHLMAAADLRNLLPNEEKLEVGAAVFAPDDQGEPVTNEPHPKSDPAKPVGGAADVA